MKFSRHKKLVSVAEFETDMAFWLLFFAFAGTQGSSAAETAVMHYGHFGGLSIACGRDELISMDSESLGYSKNTDCSPAPPCSVPYTLARWYCRGMSTCEGMQVS